MCFEFERESSLHMSMSNRCAIICCELLNFSEHGFNGKRPAAPPTRRMVQAVSVKRGGITRRCGCSDTVSADNYWQRRLAA